METEISIQERLLKATDVAEILNISRAMAYQLLQQGKIRSVNIGSARRVRLQDLQFFIEENLSPSPEEWNLERRRDD